VAESSLEIAHAFQSFVSSPSHRILHNKTLILLFAPHVIDVHLRFSTTLAATVVSTPPSDIPITNTTRPNIKMFSKTLLLGAFAALAAAQSAVLTFTNVPNPITDGQAQAITFATNDTSSVSTVSSCEVLRSAR
jgi:hypothetical protein